MRLHIRIFWITQQKIKIIANERSIAGGDVGDVSCFYPIIQFGYNGFNGAIHGVDFKIEDTYKAFVEPAKIVCGCIVDLLEKPALIETNQSFSSQYG